MIQKYITILGMVGAPVKIIGELLSIIHTRNLLLDIYQSVYY